MANDHDTHEVEFHYGVAFGGFIVGRVRELPNTAGFCGFCGRFLDGADRYSVRQSPSNCQTLFGNFDVQAGW